MGRRARGKGPWGSRVSRGVRGQPSRVPRDLDGRPIAIRGNRRPVVVHLSPDVEWGGGVGAG